jgi:hypothetical protein
VTPGSGLCVTTPDSLFAPDRGQKKQLDKRVWSDQAMFKARGFAMHIANISEAKAQLSALIEKVSV